MTNKPSRIIIALTCLCLIVSSFLHPKHVYASELDEYRVKAAFIFNFAKFIEWPKEAFLDSSAPIVLSILGEDPFGAKIKVLENKPVVERTFAVRNIQRVEDAHGGQMLFICVSEKGRLDQILRALKGSSILTISEIPNFTRLGGMIGFTTSGDKIRFEINLAIARASKLDISSKLLKLAEIVREE